MSGDRPSPRTQATAPEPLTVTQIRRIAQAVNGSKARGGTIRIATLMRVSRQAIDFWLAKEHLPSPRLGRLLLTGPH